MNAYKVITAIALLLSACEVETEPCDAESFGETGEGTSGSDTIGTSADTGSEFGCDWQPTNIQRVFANAEAGVCVAYTEVDGEAVLALVQAPAAEYDSAAGDQVNAGTIGENFEVWIKPTHEVAYVIRVQPSETLFTLHDIDENGTLLDPYATYVVEEIE